MSSFEVELREYLLKRCLANADALKARIYEYISENELPLPALRALFVDSTLLLHALKNDERAWNIILEELDKNNKKWKDMYV